MPEFPKIIILDKEKTKYDWEFYKFLFDDEILVDIIVSFWNLLMMIQLKICHMIM